MRDRSRLQHLIEQLTGEIQDFRAVSSDDLHMTIFHVGRPKETWRELKQHNPALTYKEFESVLRATLLSWQSLVPHGFRLPVLGWSEFGNPQRPTLGLAFAVLPWLEDARIQAELDWQHLMERLEVPDLRNYKEFRPHISLGRLNGPVESWPESLFPRTLRFESSRLRNVVIDD